MASLVKCPDCGQKVSFSAPACPGCGKVFSVPDKGAMYAAAKMDAEIKGEKFDGGGCFGAFVALGVFSMSLLFLGLNF